VWANFTTALNGRVGCIFDNSIKLNLGVFNILNTQASQIDYFYVSRLPTGGVADRHFHPVEPTAFRLTRAQGVLGAPVATWTTTSETRQT